MDDDEIITYDLQSLHKLTVRIFGKYNLRAFNIFVMDLNFLGGTM